jgi:hypothetical protein
MQIGIYLGHGILTKEGKIPANFILYKGPSKERKTLTFNKQKKRSSKKDKIYGKSHKEPWLLVTSLTESQIKPFLIVNIYRQRMRIEENIRDSKCPHYGLGLKNSLTQSTQRMNILLLIGAIALFTAWLAGLFMKSIGKAVNFQAHSAKFTTALSYVFLGRRALKEKIPISEEAFENILQLLFQHAAETQQEVYHYA